MDKRFVLFIGLTVTILFGHQWLMQKFFPAPPKPVVVAQKDPAAAPKATASGTAKPAASGTASNVAKPAGEVAGAAVNPADLAPAAAAQDVQPQWITLGSMSHESPFRMLVTLTNRGAAVERVELNHPRYHEVDNFNKLGGYLGYLAAENFPPADSDKAKPKPKPIGCKIHVVGPGTPAAAAGLQAGDVITAIADQPTTNIDDFAAAIRGTKPRTTVKVKYLRGAVADKPGEARETEIALGRTPLQLIHPEFSDSAEPTKADPLSFITTLQDASGDSLPVEKAELDGVELYDTHWEVLPADPKQPNSAAFKRAVPQRGVELIKRYTLEQRIADVKDDTAQAYTLRLHVELKNITDKPSLLAYRIGGPTGLPVEGAWYARDTKISIAGGGAGMRDVMYGQFDNGYPTHGVFTCTQIVDKSATHLTEKPLNYVGVDAMYFAAAMVPQKADPNERQFARVVPLQVGKTPKEKYQLKETDVSFQLMRVPVEIAPGASLKDEFKLFLGPKVPALLDEYGMGAQIDYGWFDWIAIPMLYLLHTFYGWVGNYGIAIIMLTLVVRMGMHPLTRKQAQNAQKMQQLQPEIKKLAEKYKGKREDQARAQQELFRKHNYSPFAGCLPIFIQIPIFVGLYNSLKVDVELRQAPLISENIRWASDLSAPDMLWYWQPVMPFFAGDDGWLGPFLNLLPCITICLFLLQNKMMMPPATDEQTAMQQKVMKYMMVFMGFMFFKVPAGLCVYFITGSIWSICEKMLLPKPNLAATPAAEAVIDVEVKKPGESTKRQKKR